MRVDPRPRAAQPTVTQTSRTSQVEWQPVAGQGKNTHHEVELAKAAMPEMPRQGYKRESQQHPAPVRNFSAAGNV